MGGRGERGRERKKELTVVEREGWERVGPWRAVGLGVSPIVATLAAHV